MPLDRPVERCPEEIPVTYVPAEHDLPLVALAWAEVIGAADIYIGVNALDYSGYPDCRPEYIEAYQTMADLATKAGVEAASSTRARSATMETPARMTTASCAHGLLWRPCREQRGHCPESHAIVGECGEVRREVTAGLEESRDNLTLERASRALGLCGFAEAAALTSELTRRFPTSTLTNRVAVPIATAALALARGDPETALARLEPARQYDHAPSGEFYALYLRGQAYLRLKNTKAADEAFQVIVSSRGEVPVSMFVPLSYLGLARSATLAGNVDAAKKAYQEFFSPLEGRRPVSEAASRGAGRIRPTPLAAPGN